MEQSDKQAVIDYVEGLQAQVATLKHVALELHGVISEFRNLPTKCLEHRMFDTADRYFQRINSTPEQCLAAHNAEVAKVAFIEGACSFDCDQSIHLDQIERDAEEYAAKLRAKVGVSDV